jgi:AcrR family transcriptional regulator
MSQERNTEEQIIAAAKKIFSAKGLAGARMQDIADEAGINKAMLHYYYRSKEKLFEIVFTEALDKLMHRMSNIINANLPLPDKIREIVKNYIEGLTENPHIPLFVLNELQQQPELLVKQFKTKPNFPNIQQFLMEIAVAGEKGIIKKVSPIQLMLNILSMCVFPFVAKPLLKGVTGIDEVQFKLLIEERKQFVADFILAAITP